MEKKNMKLGMTVGLPRPATVTKIKGSRAKVRPCGESSMWVQISDLIEINEKD